MANLRGVHLYSVVAEAEFVTYDDHEVIRSVREDAEYRLEKMAIERKTFYKAVLHDGPATFPAGLRAVWAFAKLDASVSMNGFDGTIDNGYAPMFPFAAEGFRLMGLNDLAKVVDQVITFAAPMVALRAKSEADVMFDPFEDEQMEPYKSARCEVSRLSGEFWRFSKPAVPVVAMFVRQNPDLIRVSPF